MDRTGKNLNLTKIVNLFIFKGKVKEAITINFRFLKSDQFRHLQSKIGENKPGITIHGDIGIGSFKLTKEMDYIFLIDKG